MFGGCRYGVTRKFMLLESMPLCVTTWTLPVVAPAGTVVVITELETTVNVAAVPLKGDAGRAGQIGSQNLDGSSHIAGGGLCFHKRAKPYRQAEKRPMVVGPATSPLSRRRSH